MFLTNEEQELIKNYPIVIVGLGIGSVIAECALRMGFENMTIIDGGNVSLSNTKEQNYTEEDIASYKVNAIKKRLLSINKEAKIKVHNCFLTTENTEEYIDGCSIAINTLGFNTDVSFYFDETCQKKQIPVLHTYNSGWGGFVIIISPKGFSLNLIRKENESNNEIQVLEYITSYLKFWNDSSDWVDKIIENRINHKETLLDSQLAITSYTIAAMCTHLLCKISTKRKTKEFPEFYVSTIINA